MFASLFDIFIISRTNISLGIPDKLAYLFGDAFIYSVASMLFFMPSVILTSKICPRGFESTTYAILAGFQNFGQNVARSIGVFLMIMFDIRTEVPCNFSNLNILVFLSHFILPLLSIPFTFLLLPNARLSDRLELDIDPEEERNKEDTGELELTAFADSDLDVGLIVRKNSTEGGTGHPVTFIGAADSVAAVDGESHFSTIAAGPDDD